MGQAKQRGSQQERQADAQAKIQARTPKSIICNHCKADIGDVKVMDSRGMAGIDGVYAATCECGHVTWAMAGDPDAVTEAMMLLQDTVGVEGTLAISRIKR